MVSCEDYLFDYIGGDIEPNDYPKVDSAFDCQKKCKENQNCNFWTWGMKTHESSNVAAIWVLLEKGCYFKNTKQSYHFWT